MCQFLLGTLALVALLDAGGSSEGRPPLPSGLHYSLFAWYSREVGIKSLR